MMAKKEKKALCSGCRDDFYNGNNPMGIEECWNLESAQITHKKKVGLWDEPPWNHQPVIECLDCRTEAGYVFVSPKQLH